MNEKTKKKISKLAILSLCSIIFLIFSNFLGLRYLFRLSPLQIGLLNLILAICALGLGISAIGVIRKNKDTLKGIALAVPGIVLGGLLVISNASPFITAPLREIGRPAQCRTDLSKIKDALKLYELDSGSFPYTEEGLEVLITNPYTERPWNGPYLDESPADPWGRAYQYRYPSKDSYGYDLFSLGKDGVESEDDIRALNH